MLSRKQGMTSRKLNRCGARRLTGTEPAVEEMKGENDLSEDSL